MAGFKRNVIWLVERVNFHVTSVLNCRLHGFQDRENSKLGNAKICQLTILVLFQSNRPIKQLDKDYTRVGDLLKVHKEFLIYLNIGRILSFWKWIVT